jgi:hypothetical protein
MWTRRLVVLSLATAGYILGRVSRPIRVASSGVPNLEELDQSQPDANEQVMAELAREAQGAQLQALESLDSKAANLIAFSGIVIGLIFTSGFAESHWTFALTVGTGLLALATAPLAFVLWREYRFDPNVGALEDLFTGETAATTNLWVVGSIRTAADRNAAELQQRTRAVRLGALILLGAVGCVAGSLIYSQETRHHSSQTPKQPVHVSTHPGR